MKLVSLAFRIVLVLNFLFLPYWQWVGAALAKIDCGPTATRQ